LTKSPAIKDKIFFKKVSIKKSPTFVGLQN